jgi:hypothetical protein
MGRFMLAFTGGSEIYLWLKLSANPVHGDLSDKRLHRGRISFYNRCVIGADQLAAQPPLLPDKPPQLLL